MFGKRSPNTDSETQVAEELFGTVRMALPNGEIVVGKIPSLKQQLEFIRLCEQIESPSARLELQSDFPKAVGLEAELNRLRWPEFVDVVMRFFFRPGSLETWSEPTVETDGRSETNQEGDSKT